MKKNSAESSSQVVNTRIFTSRQIETLLETDFSFLQQHRYQGALWTSTWLYMTSLCRQISRVAWFKLPCIQISCAWWMTSVMSASWMFPAWLQGTWASSPQEYSTLKSHEKDRKIGTQWMKQPLLWSTGTRSDHKHIMEKEFIFSVQQTSLVFDAQSGSSDVLQKQSQHKAHSLVCRFKGEAWQQRSRALFNDCL